MKPPTSENNKRYNGALTELNKDWEYFQRLTPYLKAAMKGALSPIISEVLTNKFTEVRLDSWFDGLINKVQEDWDKSMEILDRSWEVIESEVDVIAISPVVKDVFMGNIEELEEGDRDAIYMSSPELQPYPETSEEKENLEQMVLKPMEGSENAGVGRDSDRRVRFSFQGNEAPPPAMRTREFTPGNEENPRIVATSSRPVLSTLVDEARGNFVSYPDLTNFSQARDIVPSNSPEPTNSTPNRGLVYSSQPALSITPQTENTGTIYGARNIDISYASGPTAPDQKLHEKASIPREKQEGTGMNLKPEWMMKCLRV